jgi:cytidine deaminase
MGADLDLVTDILKKELADVGYSSCVIRLSSLLSSIRGLSLTLIPKPEDERIHSHMKAGTEIRTRTGWADILAFLAVARIREERKARSGNSNTPVERIAYILRSLKHKSEIDSLRDVYGDGFITISVYSPKDRRCSDLAKVIAKSHHDTHRQKYIPRAEELINIDEEEEGTRFGQNVSAAFPLADVFVEATSKSGLQKSIRRFIQIFFNNQFLTPTKDEFGMFQARAAALRSADLSRQVGSAIMTQDGDLIALGCNDVPKAGGGMYWSDDIGPDGRDFQRGFDPSSRAKTEILAETLGALEAAKMLAGDEPHDIPRMTESIIEGEHAEKFKALQIANIIEFGRIVHSEMAAITNAASRGVSVKNATLYCTVFPCHMCARLIIASGIDRVVYIEPYPKSRTQELYDDSIIVDQVGLVRDRVNFQSFVGLAPTRYQSLFAILKRKDSKGDVLEWDTKSALPRVRRFVPSYLYLEQKTTDALPKKFAESGLSLS